MTVGRSGSSATAGALHQAGISFGGPEELVPAHPDFNAKGHFERYAWHMHERHVALAIQRGVQPDGKDIAGIEAQIRKNSDKQIWGIKSVYAPWGFPYYEPMLPRDWRMIVLHRRFGAVVQSYMRHMNEGNGCSEEHAEQSVIEGWAAFYNTVYRYRHRPQYHIEFERITSDPYMAMTELLGFAYDGVDVSETQIAAAADWIEPNLRHH
jgi:hypothetical protein